MLNKQPKNRIHKQQLNINNLALNNDQVKELTDTESFYVVASLGEDFIISYTSSRNQKVKTGAGNYIITIGIGSDEVDGGDGSDLLKVDYSANTYTGTKDGLRMNAVWDYGDYSGGFYAYNSSSSYDRGSLSNIERFDII